MTVINTNVKSLVAADAINGNNSRLSTAMQRLSTGLRVNSAKDDAAGLSIGTKMDAQIRGLNMAIKNANDGFSLLQTADDSMGQVTTALQRIRELAVQASNATNTDQDRASLDAEVQQLKSMIDTIASKTQFNGINLLDGSFAHKQLLVGDKANNLLELNIGNVSTASLGTPAPLAKGVVITGRLSALAATTDNVLINGTAINAIDADSSAPAGSATVDINDMLAAINNSNVGVTATAFNEVVADAIGTGVSAGTIEITVTGLDDGEDTVIALGNTTSLQGMVDQINHKGGPDTVMARINDEGKLVLYNNSGATIDIADSNGGTEDATGFGSGDDYAGFVKIASTDGDVFSIEGDVADLTLLGLNQTTADGLVKGDELGLATTDWPSGTLSINGVDIWYGGIEDDAIPSGAMDANGLVNAINKFTKQTGVSAGLYDIDGAGAFGLTLKSSDNSPIQIKLSDALRTSNDLGLIETNVGAVDFDSNQYGSFGAFAGGRAVGSVDVLSQSSALSSIAVIDGALNKVSMQRANLGALQNRIESTVTNLSNVVTNTQSSRSRIMDADYATETTNLARAQIIQQAATAMLAQANQSAQTVLTLLK